MVSGEHCQEENIYFNTMQLQVVIQLCFFCVNAKINPFKEILK